LCDQESSLILDAKDEARVCVGWTVCCVCVLRAIISGCIRVEAWKAKTLHAFAVTRESVGRVLRVAINSCI
jgi:hypothetical protein